MKSNVSDQDLVKKFINGEHRAMDILVVRHKQKVYNYIKKLVKDSELAEDLFQDTFIKVIRSLQMGNYKDDGKFLGWVMRIAHNIVIDYYRKENKLRTVPNEIGELDLFNNAKYSEPTIDTIWTQQQITKDLKSIIQQLPEDQRSVVIMRHYLDMSFKEIAEQTNISINTALGRMRYAIINMRKLVEENNVNLILQ